VSPRSRRRLPTAALLILWIGSPLVALVHAATEQHSYCAAHEAFEEHDAPAPGARGEPLASALPAEPPADQVHHACAFSPLATGPALLALAPAPPLERAPAPPEPAAPAGEVPPPPLPLLALAPKASPPLSS
jgi:hypothetical protein